MNSLIPRLITPSFCCLQCEKQKNSWTGTSYEMDCPSSQHVTSVVTSCILTSLATKLGVQAPSVLITVDIVRRLSEIMLYSCIDTTLFTPHHNDGTSQI